MPPLAITIGDVAGVGPEVVLSALVGWRGGEVVIYATARAIDLTVAHFKALGRGPALSPIDTILSLASFRASGLPEGATVALVDVGEALPPGARAAIDALDAVPFATELAAFGHLQGVALECAIDDALAGRVSAIATAPLGKSLFLAAGRPPTGHTEILAERTGSPGCVMMLAGDVLRVALTTTHIPLARVSDSLSVERVAHTIAATAADLRRLYGLPAPRLAVAALNPHAGEAGTMGDEEQRVIAPAIARAREAGVDASGPLPADTLFARAAQPGWPFDAVVCMYHDQALIPLKLMHFGRAANITLGLPIVRTSVDHGTAYDIAGRGEADHASMLYAMELAIELAARAARA